MEFKVLPKSAICLLGIIYISCVATSIFSTSNEASEQNETSFKADPLKALLYLQQYGYLRSTVKPQMGSFISESSFRRSIMDFQAFAHLNVTGELDIATAQLMDMPRCGVRDHVGYGARARKKRYALQGSRWKISHLTYHVSKYPHGLTRAEVDRVLKKAFEVWSEASDLTFIQNRTGAQIEIRFEISEHGDGDAFDGPGGTLAHAFFPIYGGDVHFDDSETWTLKTYKGTNLFQVATHEIGHSLGLSHSDNQGALMAPFFRGYQSQFKLHTDDIKAIQKLYGKSRRVAPPLVPKGPPSPQGAHCAQPDLDAIATMADGSTYVFKGSDVFKLTDSGVASGYPKRLEVEFPQLEKDVNAAFTWTNGKTYVFKGDQYWRITEMSVESTYPKKISKGFAGIPNDVDSAFVWSGNGKIYFTKGSQYWRFDPTLRPPVKETYPKPLKNWDGLPSNIDGALQYSNGYTYFFKGPSYFRFNDRAFKVDDAEPSFPRPVAKWWFGCLNSQMSRPNETTFPVPGADDVGGNNDAEG